MALVAGKSVGILCSVVGEKGLTRALAFMSRLALCFGGGSVVAGKSVDILGSVILGNSVGVLGSVVGGKGLARTLVFMSRLDLCFAGGSVVDIVVRSVVDSNRALRMVSENIFNVVPLIPK